MNNRVVYRVLTLAEQGQGRVASSRAQVVASSERVGVGFILFMGVVSPELGSAVQARVVSVLSQGAGWLSPQTALVLYSRRGWLSASKNGDLLLREWVALSLQEQ